MWQLNHKGRSFTYPRMDFDLAAVQLDDPGRKRQPDSVPLGITLVGAPVEWSENMRQIIGGNPDPVVGKTQDRVDLVKADSNGSLVIAGEFTPVLDQVAEGHVQKVGIP